jgi:hypothetical protein
VILTLLACPDTRLNVNNKYGQTKNLMVGPLAIVPITPGDPAREPPTYRMVREAISAFRIQDCVAMSLWYLFGWPLRPITGLGCFSVNAEEWCSVAGNKQRILLVWTWVFLMAQGVAIIPLMRVVPPPSPTWSAQRLAEWYQGHSTAILIASVLLGWVSGCLIQFAVVLWHQARRVESGAKIWSTLILVSGSITAVFIGMLGLCFGTAAFTPDRAPEITQLLHQFAVFFLVTTDQLYLGAWVALAVICFTTPDRPDNPFPRWWGWTTVWTIILLEPGAVAFLPKTGLFAVNGILAFWIPLVIFGLWLMGQTGLIWRALKIQDQMDVADDRVTVADDIGDTAVVETRAP